MTEFEVKGDLREGEVNRQGWEDSGEVLNLGLISYDNMA
jgi:hypothetical protein